MSSFFCSISKKKSVSVLLAIHHFDIYCIAAMLGIGAYELISAYVLISTLGRYVYLRFVHVKITHILQAEIEAVEFDYFPVTVAITLFILSLIVTLWNGFFCI